MKLCDILSGCGIVSARVSLMRDVRGACCDSRAAVAGDLFIAIEGQRADGHDFVAELVGKGVFCVVQKKAVFMHNCILVKDTRRANAIISRNLFADNRSLLLVGITGTCGKTSTARLVAHLLNEAGMPCGFIGTTGALLPSGECAAAPSLTTPMPREQEAILSLIRAAGGRCCAMEASSHALAQNRMAGLSFACAVFTNFGRDHLDYHADKDEYLKAKLRLFAQSERAVVNADDPAAERVLAACPSITYTYSIHSPASIRATDITYGEATRFSLRSPFGRGAVEQRACGEIGVYNALAAASCALALGIGIDAVCRALSSAPAVEGRLETVLSRPFEVIVDFAHTPDSLAAAIAALKAGFHGRLITVFGCGGDRDKGKRALMGAAASLGDFTVLTSCNPRGERPDSIIDEIERGMSGRYARVASRRAAIELAMRIAHSGDRVLLAGKGHERYIEDVSGKHSFVEREVVAELAKKLALNNREC